jgi:hypothetical protein
MVRLEGGRRRGRWGKRLAGGAIDSGRAVLEVGGDADTWAQAIN